MIIRSINCFSFIFDYLFSQVVFAGFSSESLAQRIIDCKPKIVITCNAVKRGSKAIHLKDIVDAALIESAQNGVSVGGELLKLISVIITILLYVFIWSLRTLLHKWHFFIGILISCSYSASYAGIRSILWY